MRIPIKIICFIMSIIIARLLNPSDFGIMAIAMMTIGYANIISNLGLNQAIIHKAIVCRKTLNTILTTDVAISIILAICFFVGATYLAEFFREPRSVSVIRIMSLYFPVSSFYGIAHAILRRDMKYPVLASLETMQNLVTSVLTLVLALFQFGYWSLALGQIIPLILFTILFCVKAKWFPEICYKYSLIRPLFHFGIWNIVASQIGFVVGHIDKIFIAKTIGAFDLGLYDKSRSIAVMPSEAVLININSVMFSSFSRSKINNEELKRQFGKSMMLTCIISYPFYLGLIYIAQYFVIVLLGQKWEGMIVPFQIILAANLFKSFGGLLSSFNIGVGKYKEHTIRLLISGICFIYLCLIFIGRGIEGIAWAYFIYCVIEFALTLTIVISFLNISLIDVCKHIYTGTWASIVMGLCVNYLSSKAFVKLDLRNMIVLIVVGAGVYCTCLIIDRGEGWRRLKAEILSDMMSIKYRRSH